MIQNIETTGKTAEEAIDAALLLAGVSLSDVEVEVLDHGAKGVFGLGKKLARVRIVYDDGKAPPKETKKAARAAKEEKPRPPASPKTEAAAPPVPEAKPETKSRKRTKSGGAVSPAAKPESLPGSLGQKNAQAPAASDISPSEEERILVADACAFFSGLMEFFHIDAELDWRKTEDALQISCRGKEAGALIGRKGETLDALQYLTGLTASRKNPLVRTRVLLDIEGYREAREKQLAELARRMAEKCLRNGRRVELEPMNPADRRVVHLALQSDTRVKTGSYGAEPYRRVVIQKADENSATL